MKLSEILRLDGNNGENTFNGRKLDWARGGLVDAQGNFSPLRPQSFRVLDYLASLEGQMVDKEAIFTEVWPGTAVTDDSLTQCIGDIRRALHDTDRRVLETIPRKGFRLHRDATSPRRMPIHGALVAVLSLVVLGAGVMIATRTVPSREPPQQEEIATLSMIRKVGGEALAAEIATALDQYPSIRKVSGGARFELILSQPSEQRLLAELVDNATSTIVMAKSIATPGTPENMATQGSRLANRIAGMSGSAVIARTLFAEARDESLRQLTNGECYLHFYALGLDASAPGELVARSRACLQAILAKDPDNPTAMALLGATIAEQYWYGTGLDDPRDIPELRRPLAEKALDYARAAERAGLPQDADVHQAVAQVYYANCKTDLLVAKVRRLLQFRPDDPGILGPSGNWITYAGDQETGVPMAQRALDIAAESSPRWWHWAAGKDAWLTGNYEAAMEAFMRGYEENSWHNELHLVYTLPFLDRQREAEEAAARLDELWPGFTRADARRTHRRWCFDEAFIAKMDDALARAGVPDTPEIGLQ